MWRFWRRFVGSLRCSGSVCKDGARRVMCEVAKTESSPLSVRPGWPVTPGTDGEVSRGCWWYYSASGGTHGRGEEGRHTDDIAGADELRLVHKLVLLTADGLKAGDDLHPAAIGDDSIEA